MPYGNDVNTDAALSGQFFAELCQIRGPHRNEGVSWGSLISVGYLLNNDSAKMFFLIWKRKGKQTKERSFFFSWVTDSSTIL